MCIRGGQAARGMAHHWPSAALSISELAGAASVVNRSGIRSAAWRATVDWAEALAFTACSFPFTAADLAAFAALSPFFMSAQGSGLYHRGARMKMGGGRVRTARA